MHCSIVAIVKCLECGDLLRLPIILLPNLNVSFHDYKLYAGSAG